MKAVNKKANSIDVSEHNGMVNWDKVKADGIEVAFLRMGYGSDIASQDDKQFERNVRECERVGIDWGGYLYSYALDVEAAKSEVAHAERLLKGKTPTAPIGFDMEDGDHYKTEHGMPSNEVLVDICVTWLSAMESAGYDVRLYANEYWLSKKLDSPKLDPYKKWVAQYSNECTYTGEYDIWQYDSNGHEDGIEGNVDMDTILYNPEKHVSSPNEKVKAEHIDDRRKCIVTGDVWLHDAPNFDKSSEIRVLHKDEQYWIYGEKNGMYDLGQHEYVSKKYISLAINHVVHYPSVTEYTVKSGDSLSKIANKFNTSVNHIMQLNPGIKDPDKIYVGQIIHLVEHSNNNKHEYHKVVLGDSLSKIALKYHTTVQELMQLNPQINDKDTIYVGQAIRVK